MLCMYTVELLHVLRHYAVKELQSTIAIDDGSCNTGES